MNELGLLLTPGGLVLASLLLALLFGQFRATRTSVRTQRTVQKTLVAAGKQAVASRLTLLIDIRRRASYYEDWVASLQPLGASVEVVAVVHHTAGPSATAALRTLAKKHAVSLKTIRYVKKQTVAMQLKRATGTYVLRVHESMRIPAQVVERLSYLFATGASALQLPQLVLPGTTLGSVFAHIRSVIRAVLKSSRTSGSEDVLPFGVVRRVADCAQPVESATYVPVDIASLWTTELNRTSRHKVLRAVATVSLLLIAIFAGLLTPASVIGFLSLLAGAVLIVMGATALNSVAGSAMRTKLTSMALLPFYPLYAVFDALLSLRK